MMSYRREPGVYYGRGGRGGGGRGGGGYGRHPYYGGGGHGWQKPFKCPFCSDRFATNLQMAAHKRSYHRLVYDCGICKDIPRERRPRFIRHFTQLDAKRHVQECHPEIPAGKRVEVLVEVPTRKDYPPNQRSRASYPSLRFSDSRGIKSEPEQRRSYSSSYSSGSREREEDEKERKPYESAKRTSVCSSSSSNVGPLPFNEGTGSSASGSRRSQEHFQGPPKAPNYIPLRPSFTASQGQGNQSSTSRMGTATFSVSVEGSSTRQRQNPWDSRRYDTLPLASSVIASQMEGNLGPQPQGNPQTPSWTSVRGRLSMHTENGFPSQPFRNPSPPQTPPPSYSQLEHQHHENQYGCERANLYRQGGGGLDRDRGEERGRQSGNHEDVQRQVFGIVERYRLSRL